MFGPGGISIWQLLIILVIVVLLFGTKKIRGMGGDLGAAIKSFRKSVKEEGEDDESDKQESLENASQETANESQAEADKEKS